MTPATNPLRRREDRGILRFVHEQFGVSPDAWQEEAPLTFASAPFLECKLTGTPASLRALVAEQHDRAGIGE